MRFGWRSGLPALIAAVWFVGATEARAQARPIAVEATVGWAGFVDDATIEHTVFGGGVRIPVLERLSIGPEVVYMVGPRDDRDLFVLGSLWFDVVRDRPDRHVVPYLVAGGGYMRHSDRFGGATFSSGEGSFTAGGGARVRVVDRVEIGADIRVGWELHLRTTATVGVRLPSR